MDQLVIHQTRLDTVIVEPAGEIDLYTAEQFKTALLDSVNTAARVVVRLDQVSFLDSTGISALVSASNEAAKRGVVLCLATPSSAVARTIEVTGIEQAIPVHPHVETALEHTVQAAEPAREEGTGYA